MDKIAGSFIFLIIILQLFTFSELLFIGSNYDHAKSSAGWGLNNIYNKI
jgi:hypothetical protein